MTKTKKMAVCWLWTAVCVLLLHRYWRYR